MFMVVVVMTMVFIDIIKTSKSSHLDGRNSFESQHQHEWWWWQWWFWIWQPYSSKHQGQVTLVGGTLLKVQVVATFCPTAYLSAIHFIIIFPLICLVKILKMAMSSISIFIVISMKCLTNITTLIMARHTLVRPALTDTGKLLVPHLQRKGDFIYL